jgi:hypothetical protein
LGKGPDASIGFNHRHREEKNSVQRLLDFLAARQQPDELVFIDGGFACPQEGTQITGEVKLYEGFKNHSHWPFQRW